MTDMQLFTETLEINLNAGPDIADITTRLNDCVKKSNVVVGMAGITIIGSTGSLTTVEYEPGVVSDLIAAINRLAPEGMNYAHELAWHDGNGHSHVQAALLGPSLSISIRNGKLALGTWQQVVAINHDVKPRQRKIEVTIVGTLVS